MLNAHCTRPEGHFVLFAGHSSKSGVLGNGHVLICFQIITQHSKGVHYFHRVVGLVVINVQQWSDTHSFHILDTMIIYFAVSTANIITLQMYTLLSPAGKSRTGINKDKLCQ